MTLQEMYARKEELRQEGKEAVKASNQTKADEVKAQLDALENEIKAEIMFMDDEQARSTQAQAQLAVNAQSINAGALPIQQIAKRGGNDTQDPTASLAYHNAVLDDLRGIATAEQAKLISEVNAKHNAHNTDRTGTVIPTTLVGRIWTKVGELFPMWNDIPRTYIAGKVTYDRNIAHNDSGEWQAENQPTPSVEFQFDELELDGHELSRGVDISFKLEAMSRADFESHLVTELAQLVGKALAVAVYRGTGVRQPRGIRTALLEDMPSQIHPTSQLQYSDLTTMFSKIKSGLLPNAVIYANNFTIWQELANLTDNQDRPILMMTVANGRVVTIFGVPVRESGEMEDGEILLANHMQGYRANVNPVVGTGVERDNRNRITGHFMHAIVDGGVLDVTAYSMIRRGTGGASAPLSKSKK